MLRIQSYNISQTQLACDVKDSERWTSGDRPVDLYQLAHMARVLAHCAPDLYALWKEIL